MGKSENILKICESLTTLGYAETGEKIRDALTHSQDDPLAAVGLALDTTVTILRNEKYKKCLKDSKLGDPVFLDDLYTYKVRQLDVEYIQSLARVDFIREKRNLVIWGAPGTGKTWMAKAMATRACQEGIRTKWITYPVLCRELMRLRTIDPKKMENRINYYCRFKLLCIDEFPNYEVEDKFIMQEFFNQMKIKGHSMIISGQCCPENWDSLFEVQSFGQSIRGRITENACRLEMKGPDLRNYVPEEV